MKNLKSAVILILIISVSLVYVVGCASSRSGEVYSRDEERQIHTFENGTVESVK